MVTVLVNPSGMFISWYSGCSAFVATLQTPDDGLTKSPNGGIIEMGVVNKLLISESIDEEKIDKFEKKAREFNSEVKIISTETREGTQLKDLGGIAAILRYEINS